MTVAEATVLLRSHVPTVLPSTALVSTDRSDATKEAVYAMTVSTK